MSWPANLPFEEVWLVDWEFGGGSGERPIPRCFVAHELRSGRRLRVWEDELLSLDRCPYGLGERSLFVAFFSSAEFSCHLERGWPLPANVLDLYVEFRNLTNGLDPPSGSSLLGALSYFGLDGVDAAEKDEMRQLAMRGGPWTHNEIVALLRYCESDVIALLALLAAMIPTIDLPRALLRGRFMRAVARMEHAGIPVDVPALHAVREAWPRVKRQLITDVDASFGIFDGETFRHDRFATWLRERHYSWPLTATGRLALDADTFRAMVRIHPELATLHELRHSLSQLRLEGLDIGSDGRNRTMLSPYRSKTGRNQPSNTRFIFGPATWIRSFIRPLPGWGLAYIDYVQEEWGIAATCSGDERMMAAYDAGDAYIAFATKARAWPAGATKETHSELRDRFKACGLGVQYGMGESSLSSRIGQSSAHAAELLRLHRRLYARYWTWSETVVNYAFLRGELHTVFGWRLKVATSVNPRSLANFPIQAT